MQAIRRNARTAAAAALGLLLGACQMAGLPTPGGADAAAERAARLARQGDHAAAAQGYEAAARDAAPDAANAYWLAAAREWLVEKRVDAAQAAIANVTAPVTAADTREQRRLEAEVALARGDTA